MHQLKWIEQRVETSGNLNKISGYASTEIDRTKSENLNKVSGFSSTEMDRTKSGNPWKPEQDIRVCIY